MHTSPSCVPIASAIADATAWWSSTTITRIPSPRTPTRGTAPSVTLIVVPIPRAQPPRALYSQSIEDNALPRLENTQARPSARVSTAGGAVNRGTNMITVGRPNGERPTPAVQSASSSGQVDSPDGTSPPGESTDALLLTTPSVRHLAMGPVGR